MNLWSYVKEKMQQYPRQVISELYTSITYEEILVAAEEVGVRLAGQSCCAIYCKSELHTAIALLGCFSAGVTAVPLSVRYGAKHCNKILQAVSPSCVITDIEGEFGIYDILDSEYNQTEEDVALIMYTSGTSGKPKGAMLGSEGIIANIKDICLYFSLKHDDTMLISRPLYHSAVLTGEFLTSLVCGARIVFFSEQFNPKSLIDLMREEHVSVFCGTPTMFDTLSHFIHNWRGLHIRKLAVSGECLSDSSAKKIRNSFPNAKIYHVYGLTEASPRVSYLPPEEFDHAPTTVGIPLQSVSIKIVDDGGHAVSDGTIGMLWISGKNIMHGYYNDPDLTSKVLINGWLKTGDLAYITEEGWIQIKGRKDDLIIRAGMNIYPQEIESELKKDSRTKDVLVFGSKSKKGDTQIHVKISGDFATVDEVMELCKTGLPSYQIPSKIEIVQSVKKTISGKTMRVKDYA